MNSDQANIPRILFVDSDESVHASVSALLFAPAPTRSFFKDGLDRLAGKLFDRPSVGDDAAKYDLVFCLELEKALEEVARAIKVGSRFALIFLDMKIVLTAEGLAKVEKIRRLEPLANILIMATGSPSVKADISARIQPVDKLFYIEKPRLPREIKMLALLLSAKWQAEKEFLLGNMEFLAARDNLEASLAARTLELKRTRFELDALRQDLQSKEEMVARQASELEESAVAMKVLLKNIAIEDPALDDKVLHRKIREMDEKIILNVKELTEPFLDKLETTSLNDEQKEYLAILRDNLDQVTSPVMQRLYASDYGLTSSEVQVANLVRQGKSSKNIAAVLRLSVRTIEFHRDKIRKKLGLKDRKTSLKDVLNSSKGLPE